MKCFGLLKRFVGSHCAPVAVRLCNPPHRTPCTANNSEALIKDTSTHTERRCNGCAGKARPAVRLPFGKLPHTESCVAPAESRLKRWEWGGPEGETRERTREEWETGRWRGSQSEEGESERETVNMATESESKQTLRDTFGEEEGHLQPREGTDGTDKLTNIWRH